MRGGKQHPIRYGLLAVLLLAFYLPTFTQSTPAFQAHAFNLLREGGNTFLYLNLSPNLFGIGESGYLEADLDFHFSFSPAQLQTPYLERSSHKVIRHDFFSGNDPFFQEFSFELPQGPWWVEIEVKDRAKGRTYLKAFAYESRLLTGGISLSDILLIQEVEGVPVPRPLITEQLEGLPNRLRFRAEVYSPSDAVMTARAILYREDVPHPGPDDREFLQVRQYTSHLQLNEVLEIQGGKAIFSDGIDLFELPQGAYLLELFLYQDDSLIAEQNSRFRLPWKRLKEVFLDLDASIDQLSHIADPATILRLKSIPDMGDKLQAFETFWEARNEPGDNSPTAALERYYGRIFYVNQYFQENTPGWQTARGRIHILYGTPENQNQTKWQGREFELWEYPRKRLRFLFERSGGGWALKSPL